MNCCCLVTKFCLTFFFAIFNPKSFNSSCLLYPFFKLGALGAGDVKLLGICAGFLQYDKILHFLFFSLLAAAIFAMIKLIREQNARERLAYLREYLADVARSGKWSLYIENEREARKIGIALAGPILVSVFLHIGGVY